MFGKVRDAGVRLAKAAVVASKTYVNKCNDGSLRPKAPVLLAAAAVCTTSVMLNRFRRRRNKKSLKQQASIYRHAGRHFAQGNIV